jgi:hypothetical protein
MAQNLSNFYQTARERDFARQFQFRVQGLQVNGFAFSEQDLLYVETASLPARAINNVQVPYMGLNFNVPGTAQYPGSDNYEVTFRCDANYNIRALLESISFATFDEQTSTGDFNTPRPSSTLTLELLGNSPSGNVNSVNSVVKTLNASRTYTLYGVYVRQVGAVQYNIGNAGEIVKIPATLAYQYWQAGAPVKQNR